MNIFSIKINSFLMKKLCPMHTIERILLSMLCACVWQGDTSEEMRGRGKLRWEKYEDQTKKNTDNQ